MSTPFPPARPGAADHDRAEVLFLAALKQPPEDRAAFLDQECGAAAELRAEVEGLLSDHENAEGFLSIDAPLSPTLEAEFARLKPEEAGERIGNYKLLQQIGEGGFGVVWMAEQEHPMRRKVALKIIKLGMDTKEVIARFEQERQALAMMEHPNIAKVFDAGATPFGRPFFAMELVNGVRITEYCDEAKLSTADRLRLFVQVCHAIQHAHQKGIIHRDLKPGNILVTLHDGVPVPKVIDFGVAKATQQQRLTDLTLFTEFQQMVGTPLYMSPEQTQLSGLDIDTRTDIYSLGVLLYELLTGRTPFDPEQLMKAGYDEMRRVIREQEPQKPSTFVSTLAVNVRTSVAQHRQADGARLVGQIRGDLDWIVMKALEKDRNRRYETANGFASDIERHLSSEPVQARPPTPLYRFRRFARRNKGVFAAGSAVLLALLVGLAIATWMFFQEKHARERAVAAEREQGRLRALAVAAEKAQVQERKKAESEASKSGQVAQFLTEMLKGVGPSVALGRDTKLLREILDKTAERVSKDLHDQPEVEADLRKIIGDVYRELGDYERAKAMHTEALALRKKRFGNEHRAVAESLADVASILYEQGKLTDAETMTREALAMRRRLLGNEHEDVADSLAELAGLLGEQGKLAEAETLHREALAMLRKLFGNEHKSVATSLNNLAIVLHSQSKLADAEATYRESLMIKQKLQGSEHPDIAISLGNLAQVLRDEGKLADAESMNREALVMDRKLLGAEHPSVATSLNNLAAVLDQENKLSEAEPMFRGALEMERKLLGHEHPEVATTLENLAGLLARQNKLPEAETMLEEALTIQRKLRGNEHPATARALSGLANVLYREGKSTEAEAMHREALALRRKLLGSGHSEVAASLDNLALVLRQQGKLAETEILFREELVIQRKEFGNEHPAVARSLSDLSDALVHQGKFAEAEAMSREALSIGRKLAKSSEELEVNVYSLAETLFRQKKYAEAEPLYREIVERRKARLPAEHGEIIIPMASLARLLTEWAWSEYGQKFVNGNFKSQAAERAREAVRLLRECLAMRLRGANPNSWRAADVRSRLGGALLVVAVSDPGLVNKAHTAKFAEAEAFMLQGNEALQSSVTAEKKYKRDALARLVRLYETWKKPDKAVEWRRKLADFDKASAQSDSKEKDASPKS